MRNTFGGEGDVADLLQFSAQMEMDEIRCIRLAAARLQQIELDDKSITWGASGQRAWGQNVLTGAARERHDIILVEELAIIHPQAFLQHERAINLDPHNKTATARAFVKLHNDMQRAPPRKGFSLLNHDVQPLLVNRERWLHTQRQGQVVHPRVPGSGRFGRRRTQSRAHRERGIHGQHQGRGVQHRIP